MRVHLARAGVAAAALALALPAAAHPGHAPASGFVAGLLHPLSGIDHLLALLAVGLWRRQQTHGALLAPTPLVPTPLVPTPLVPMLLMPTLLMPTFLVLMALGAASSASLHLPALELSIAATVLLLGGLVACAPRLQRRVPPQLALPTVGACAFVHGLAHGNELSGLASGAGFILASLGLMLLGAMSGVRLGQRLCQRLGAAIGAAGLALVALAA